MILLLVPTQAHPLRIHHDLHVSLLPEQKRLVGTDRMTLHLDESRFLSFSLSGKAVVLKVALNGRAAAFTFRDGILSLGRIEPEEGGAAHLSIEYTAVFDDPVPSLPLNTDNPGYGVTGSVSEQGTFLQAGAGWHPALFPTDAATRVTYLLTVEAPSGVIAVSAGRSLGHETKERRTFSRWEVTHPIRGLSLSAANYVIDEREVGGVRIATYFFPESSHLSSRYLEATSRYITLYEGLFGAYPFDKFAVVENFFPTGYGFPSYTLLGSRVLRLPFILETSLGHEIAHCWWGNGVFVDYSKGNWSEALTTYVADYLYKELESEEKAREYRRQALRNYAALVDPREDFPLASFRSREDPVSKAIGYDKGAMVFHMLRRLIGEEAFWGALRDIYGEKLFQLVSWNDWRTAFERRSNSSLQVFFDQWVRRGGAPALSLSEVRERDEPCAVQGKVLQAGDAYELKTELLLETEISRLRRELRLSGNRAYFEFPCDSPPLRLFVDPDHHLFRRLSPHEIPPTVNSLKGSPSIVLVLSEGSGPGAKEDAVVFARSLGLKEYRIIRESDLVEEDRKKDLLLLGLPERQSILTDLPEGITLHRDGFVLNGTPFEEPSDSFFGVFDHPSRKGGVLALFYPLSREHAQTVARKVTHYGRYSYLAFRGEENVDSGTWITSQSPLIERWERPAREN
jgi:hypothetical protein